MGKAIRHTHAYYQWLDGEKTLHKRYKGSS